MRLRLFSTLFICLIGGRFGLGAESQSFTDCEEAFRLHPDNPEAATCFYLAAQKGREWLEAGRRLEALKLEYPDNHWLELILGHLDLVQGRPEAEQHYRTAADGFASAGNAAGEVVALTNLRNLLQRRGRVEEAGRVVQEAVRVASNSTESTVVARAGVLEATHILESGGDLGSALLAVRQAVAAAFPEGTYGLKRQCLFALARICTRLGRYQEAREAYQRISELMQEAGDLYEEPTMISNRANLWLRELEEMADPSKLPAITALAEEALDKAVNVGNRGAEVRSHRILAEILGADPGRRADAKRHLDACFRVGERNPSNGMIECLWTASEIFADSDPLQSRIWLQRAIRLAIETDNPLDLAYAWQAKMKVGWKESQPREALADSLRALSAIEALRDLQGDEPGSVGVFSQWARDYQWLVGSLLNGAQGTDRWAVAEAFSVLERMRARFLLDRLASSRLPSRLPPTHPLLRRRQEVNQRMVALQRKLLAPELDSRARTEAIGQLDQLDVQYQEILSQLREASPDEALREPMFATLHEVESGLEPNQAMLSFQVAQWKDVLGRFAGGAWLLLTTRNGTRVFRLPDRKPLRQSVSIFLGLLRRRDGRELNAATQLYRDLLADALATLPKSIDHLILVPDDILHHLPFAALRPAPGDPQLARTFELTIVPSATLWSHWRRARATPHDRAALALADPELPYMGDQGSLERGWPIATGTRLGRLPYARREGDAVRRRLGGSSLLKVGPEASEEFIKSADLGGYAVLHLAAHAVVDEETPARSAVLLAPGGEDQDGLWQVREIVESNLAGQLVVLSACRTASGAVLSGEGVLGLSRAFFQAGAHTVLGTLWPLRDDEAAWFFEHFYRHLGQGKSISAAMRQAQSEAIDSGFPTAAWSGLVVLGDGNLIPFPGGVRPADHWSPAWLLLPLIVILALALWFRLGS